MITNIYTIGNVKMVKYVSQSLWRSMYWSQVHLSYPSTLTSTYCSCSYSSSTVFLRTATRLVVDLCGARYSVMVLQVCSYFLTGVRWPEWGDWGRDSLLVYCLVHKSWWHLAFNVSVGVYSLLLVHTANLMRNVKIRILKWRNKINQRFLTII